MTDKDRELTNHKLLQIARDTANNSYSRYSHFRVGAAVKGALGIYKGANVENASYGLAVCAERVALGAAISAGDRKISAIAVACLDASVEGSLEERMPCGACLQWISELAPHADIIIDGAPRSFKIEELLPYAFTLGTSKKEHKA